MNSTDETIVELSKTKIVLLILGACLFVAAGVHFLSFDQEYIRSERAFGFLFNNPTYVYAIGIAAIVCFGLVGLLGLKKLFDTKPGLVFNNFGIVDNASFLSAGLIPWSDVEGAEILEIQSQKILIIKVRDPQKYFERGNSLKRAFNKGGYNGNPIGIPSIALKMKFPELITLFNEYLRKYGNMNQHSKTESLGHSEMA